LTFDRLIKSEVHVSGEQKLDRSVLEGKKADELKAIASAVGVPLSGRPTKAGVIDQILSFTGTEVSRPSGNGNGKTNGAAVSDTSSDAAATTTERPRRTRSRKPTAAPPADGDATTQSSSGDAGSTTATNDGSGSSDSAQQSNNSQGDGGGTDSASNGASSAASGSGSSGGDGRSRTRGFDSYSADPDSGGGNNRNRRRRGRRNGRTRTEGGPNYESRVEVAEANFQGEPIPVTGFLELRDEGFGFLRTRGFLASSGDVYVPVSQVRKFGLRKGDYLEGTSRPAANNEKYPALLNVDKVSGHDPEVAKLRPKFEELTPLFPDQKLRLETPRDPNNLTARIVDLMSPIGKGQRGLIVSPPKAGKTTVMKQIAHSIEANNPEVHLIVLLVDERPEEVTDMRRSVKGEVIASTFDRPAEEHTKVAELAIERAKRLVEQGTDVVIILDGITRLARAYNLAAPASGRILSGGVDSGALYPPKKFFGSARNIEEGGSLTILATALVETGSKMDEVIFEEFKGTGNMELKLDRRLAERRLYPAIDANGSSTRHEELLFDRTQLTQVWKLRRVLNALAQDGNTAAGLELLMDKIKSTASNDEFLAEIAKNPTPGA
jgi:transcription termination factor Rho